MIGDPGECNCEIGKNNVYQSGDKHMQKRKLFWSITASFED